MKLQQHNLHPYQLRAIDHILAHPFCALFLDMGLGKTITTLTALQQLIEQWAIGKILIVAPKRVAQSTWTNELNDWAHLEGLTAVRIIGSQSCKHRGGHLHYKP